MMIAVTVPLRRQYVEKLAHVRFLHQQGVEQSRRPEPLSATAVLSFHDAIEMFYVVACEHLGIQIRPAANFGDYWAKIAEVVPNLVQRRGMERLNRVRVDYKHQAQIPGTRQVEQTRDDVHEFLLANTPLIFGTDYSALSMVDVVPQPETKASLHAATLADSNGDRREAMGRILVAFHELFDPHQRPEPRSYGRPAPIRPFELGGQVIGRMSSSDIARVLQSSPEQTRRAPTRGNEVLAEQIDRITEVALATQTAVRVLALGIDHHRYARFQALTPMYAPGFADPSAWRAPDGYAPNDEEYQYCLQFVVDAALRLAEIEQHLVMPSWTNPR